MVDSIWRQIGYIWNYADNIQSLRRQLEKLRGEKQVLLHRVEEATRKGEEIEDVVNNWLSNVNHAIRPAEKILQDNDRANHFCLMGCCPNMKARYQLSRKAKKEALVLVDIGGEGKFHKISYLTALEGIGPVNDYEAFESRTLILNQILEVLKNADVSMIGVCGMPGVGKTTLAKKVAEEAKKYGIFKQVVMAAVTENVDLQRIQQQIAEWLGLKIDVESIEVRAALLRSRLKKEEKIVVILDDIWTTVKLEDIGIPFGKDHQGCKILVTSRNLNVLWEMGIESNFKLQVLEEAEARQLFEKKVGILKHSEMQTMVVEAAKRCAGLPVLIGAVATALRNKELYEWKDALERLKRPVDENMDGQVQSALELSYNFLKNDEIKSLFLFLGQFLFHSYHVNTFLNYVVGLNLFKQCKTLEEARNRLHRYVNDLKSSCLLLEGDSDREVKMHDVVRSFAISLALRDHHVYNVALTNS